MTHDHPWTLDVTDFGPIVRARVDLRPLTVFVGPGNTGKSWLATLVYALHRAFEGGPGPWVWTGGEESSLPEGAKDHLVAFLSRWMVARAQGSEAVEEGVPLTLPVETALQLYVERQSAPIGAEIERCLGVDAGGNLVRHPHGGSVRVLLRHPVAGVSSHVEHDLAFGDREWTLRSTIPEGSRIRAGRDVRLSAANHVLDLIRKGDPDVQTIRTWETMDALARDFVTSGRRAFYLPADRTGLMNAHGAVVRALVRRTAAGGTGPDPAPTLSGVRADFLARLVSMAPDAGKRVGERERLGELGTRIENVLGGAVRAGSLPGAAYPHFTWRPSGWESDLPLTIASSTVSELAPVVLYLRHVVAPGDLLIIDEPESHLHPAMQVAFTREIAQIVRAGVRIIVTTHSEWVLEELGNVVGRSRLDDPAGEEPGAGALAAGDVGVWRFEQADDGGSTVQEIAMDEDSGLYPSGFATVAAALHNDWAAIAKPRGDAE